ncbi:hypothetical protein D3C86_1720910 [compost metagenome]
MLLHVVRQHGVDDDALTGVFQGGFDVGAGAHALLVGFLDQHFAADQVFLDGFAQLWGISLFALGDDLFDDGFDFRRWNGLAINSSNVLCECRGCNDSGQG